MRYTSCHKPVPNPHGTGEHMAKESAPFITIWPRPTMLMSQERKRLCCTVVAPQTRQLLAGLRCLWVVATSVLH